MNLSNIKRFRLPLQLAGRTETSLREAGRDGNELFVLWSGVMDSPEGFTLLTAHVPHQVSYRFEEGVGVVVRGDALHHLNSALFESGEALAAQVHSHPTGAYHSVTDDTYPIVTARGGLSIVVPDFGADTLLGPGTVSYRLRDDGWVLAAPEDTIIEVI